MSSHSNEIQRYLQERQTTAKKGLERGSVARAFRRISSHRFRQSAKTTGTLLFDPLTRRKIHDLVRAGGDIHLNLGSGRRKIDGWINVDVLGMNPDLHWDLRRGIPFPDGSVQAAFLEHFVEHLPLPAVFGILDECRRVLVPGGTIRIGVPDFGRYLLSYAGDQQFIEANRPNRPTPLLAVAEVALFHGHRSVWDGTTLTRVLTEAGFVGVRERPFGDSSLKPAPDTPAREAESVYAEGVKPPS